MLNLVPYRNRRGLARGASNSIFDDPFFRPFFNWNGPAVHNAFRVDIKDRQDHYELDADLPGVEQKDISLAVEDKVLTISAELNSETKEEREDYLCCERRVGHFQRSFSLEGIDEENIKAAYKNGVLTVRLPKEKPTEGPAKRQITIGEG